MVRSSGLFPWLAVCIRWRRLPTRAIFRRHVAPVRRLQRRARNVVERHRLREGWEVMFAYLSSRLESRGKFDQDGLAERRSEKADTKRCSEHHARRHLNNWIT